MKKFKVNQLVLILTALFSTNIFAADQGSLSFDLSNQDEADAKDPYFHCEITKDNGVAIGSIASSTSVKFTADAYVNLGESGKVIDNVSVSDIKDKYFYVTKDQRGEGHVFYATNNKSDIVCAKGKGNKSTQYNE